MFYGVKCFLIIYGETRNYSGYMLDIDTDVVHGLSNMNSIECTRWTSVPFIR